MISARGLMKARTFAMRPAQAMRPRASQMKAPLGKRFNSDGPVPGAQFVRERQEVKEHAAKSSILWKRLSIYAVIPALVIASVNAYNLWNEHWEHWAHMPPLEERTEYPYQNIRSKNFPFGDGDKTLFWNESVNHHKAEPAEE